MWEDKMFRIKVIFRLLHFGFKSDMNFHFDFFCGLFSSILWIGLPIVFFRLIFLNIDSFNGWDYYQILLKLPRNKKYQEFKNFLVQSLKEFNEISAYKSIEIKICVDY